MITSPNQSNDRSVADRLERDLVAFLVNHLDRSAGSGPLTKPVLGARRLRKCDADLLWAMADLTARGGSQALSKLALGRFRPGDGEYDPDFKGDIIDSQVHFRRTGALQGYPFIYSGGDYPTEIRLSERGSAHWGQSLGAERFVVDVLSSDYVGSYSRSVFGADRVSRLILEQLEVQLALTVLDARVSWSAAGLVGKRAEHREELVGELSSLAGQILAAEAAHHLGWTASRDQARATAQTVALARDTAAAASEASPLRQIKVQRGKRGAGWER